MHFTDQLGKLSLDIVSMIYAFHLLYCTSAHKTAYIACNILSDLNWLCATFVSCWKPVDSLCSGTLNSFLTNARCSLSYKRCWDEKKVTTFGLSSTIKQLKHVVQIGNQESSQIKRHVTIRSHMANKKVIDTSSLYLILCYVFIYSCVIGCL